MGDNDTVVWEVLPLMTHAAYRTDLHPHHWITCLFQSCQVFKMKIKGYIPDFKLAFEHFCIHTGGRGVIEEIEKQLQLAPDNVQPSKDTLFRYGNTSSSSIWSVLAALFLDPEKPLPMQDVLHASLGIVLPLLPALQLSCYHAGVSRWLLSEAS